MADNKVTKESVTIYRGKKVRINIQNGSSFIGVVTQIDDYSCILSDVFRELASGELGYIPQPVSFGYDLITSIILYEDAAEGKPRRTGEGSTGTGQNSGTTVRNDPETIEDIFADLDLEQERERHRQKLSQRTLVNGGQEGGELPKAYDASKSFFDGLPTHSRPQRRENSNRNHGGNNGGYGNQGGRGGYGNRSDRGDRDRGDHYGDRRGDNDYNNGSNWSNRRNRGHNERDQNEGGNRRRNPNHRFNKDFYNPRSGGNDSQADAREILGFKR